MRSHWFLSRRIVAQWYAVTEARRGNPDTGSPQGGKISPILANVYLHYALDIWFEKVVKPHCCGEATIIRCADDWVCASQYKGDAERFYKVLPKRLGKFSLEVAPDKTRLLRFSRYNVGLQRRLTFLGFEFYWKEDQRENPCVARRTAPKISVTHERLTAFTFSHLNVHSSG